MIQQEPIISEPVVAVAMSALTMRVDMTNSRQITLADYRDRAAMTQALLILRYGGHELDKAEIIACARANGWLEEGIKRLNHVFTMFAKRKTPRGPRGAGKRWRSDVLEMWREEAGWEPHPVPPSAYSRE